ncbi:MAG: hypothetical protein JF614_25270 [Acidobacteria bacterium]|nr:hypothetical protein [Acidobacteriota bacterium]
MTTMVPVDPGDVPRSIALSQRLSLYSDKLNEKAIDIALIACAVVKLASPVIVVVESNALLVDLVEDGMQD